MADKTAIRRLDPAVQAEARQAAQAAIATMKEILGGRVPNHLIRDYATDVVGSVLVQAGVDRILALHLAHHLVRQEMLLIRVGVGP